MSKISIRFYKDHEVRALWDEDKSRWYFSIVDIVAAITESPRPRVYWGTVKNRQKEEYSQLYSKCIQLKLTREIFMKGIDYSYYYEQED